MPNNTDADTDPHDASNALPPSPASVQTAFKRNSGVPDPDPRPSSSASQHSSTVSQQPSSKTTSPARQRRPSSALSNQHARTSSTGEVPGLAAPVGARVKGLRTSLNAEKLGEEKGKGKSGVEDKGAIEEEKEVKTSEGVSEALKQVKEGAILRDGGELDEFGLPVKPRRRRAVSVSESEDEFKDAEEGFDEERERDQEGTKKEDNDRDTEKKEESPSEEKWSLGKDDNEEAVHSKGSKDDPSSPDSPKDTKPRSYSTTSRGSAPSVRGRADSALAQIIEAGADGADAARGGVSQFSHQALATQKLQEKDEEEEEQWQAMPAYSKFDYYNDSGRIVAKGQADFEEEDVIEHKGGAGRGYTKIKLDDDAESQTSMDENTAYLFKDKQQTTALQDEDEDIRDPLSQMQATKDLLTEGQRIAYVGVTRLSIVKLVEKVEEIDTTKGTKKDLQTSIESMKMWGQKMMVRLYGHMDIDASEQVMIEQLAEHGVQPSDLVPALMQNARVKNPMADESADESRTDASKGDGPEKDAEKEPDNKLENSDRKDSISSKNSSSSDAPPAYDMHQNDEMALQDPETLRKEKNIDIDLRWTVLCDLFLVLIADSVYDSRSRALLEAVGDAMSIPWMDICRFEKRITDALEMQEQANRENWDEAEHMESRRKMGLKRRYMVMGLATVGGGLVIGLSAGLLAPLIGSGLAAGFTAIGVAGTSGFLAGAGGAAIITTGSVVSGGIIAVRASNRRTGAVKTFEYRPLHNNKRVNLIVTVSGWMNGKVDDVRLPFSTVDPIMGDIYSVLWEPDMLQSIGDTIRILATEALTSGLQQVLAATFLTTLMASLSLPVVLAKLSYLLDNPWSVSQDRADSAGQILADSLIDRNLGSRPITLVGFSLGSRLIFSCLKELANKGAYGLIQNVYLFGSPVVAKKDEYIKARTVVSGRFVNAYSTNDWILGYLFRATAGGISRIAGLAAVNDVPGVENKNVTEWVNGHMAYRAAMPKLLRELGWEVESDEFTEIEDPDPENHEARQRELIREIEDARKEAEEKVIKKKTRWWQRAPKDKKSWETYEVGEEKATSGGSKEEKEDGPVLFDVDAIRKELESEQLEVRQLESTLPPMQISLKHDEPNSHPYERAKELEKESSTPKSEASQKDKPKEDKLKNGYVEPARPTYDSWEDYDEQANGKNEPTMSFEPIEKEHSSLPVTGRSSSASPGGDRVSEKARPELKTTATSPATVAAAAGVAGTAAVGAAAVNMNVNHNAWADEEDDEFANAGKGEATMSFE